MRAFYHKFILLILVSLSSFYVEPQNRSEYLSPTSIFTPTPLSQVDFIVKKIRAYPKSLQMMFVYSHFNPYHFPEEFKSETQAEKSKLFASFQKQFAKSTYLTFRENWEEAMEVIKATFIFSFPSKEDFLTTSKSKNLLDLIALRHRKDPTQNRFLKMAVAKDNVLQFFKEMKIAETLWKKLKEFRLEETASRLTGIYNIEGLSLSYSNNQYRLVQSNRLIEGEHLEDYLKRYGPQPFSTTLTIIEQLLEALIFFKELGLIHGDITDTNVLIQEEDQVKVIDFGIAEFFSTKNSFKENTFLFGTIPFVSPKSILTCEKTYQDELWSVGILFYQLLNADLPFTADDESLFFKEVCQKQPVLKLSSYKKGSLEYATAQVINKMLSSKPAQQYQTAEEVLTAIQQIRAKYLQKPVPYSNAIAISL